MPLTREGAFCQALFDPVSAAHVEGFGDLLVHEGFIVEDVRHHHAQVKHLQQLSDVGNVHQLLFMFIQLACICVVTI